MKKQIQFPLNGPLKNLIPKRFVFLRHGRTDWNCRSLVMGKKDIELDATGETQADDASNILIKQKITSIWTSPLSRCQRTAWYTAQKTGFDPQIVNGFAERDWGEYEGGNRDTRPNRMQTPIGGESHDDFQRRTISALERINDPFFPLIVAHSGTFRALLNAAGISHENKQVNFAIPILFEGV